MLQNLEDSKFDANALHVVTSVSPSGDPNNLHFGIVPGQSVSPEQQASTAASAPPAEQVVGTPAELRARHGNLRGSQPSFAPPPLQSPASLNLRGSLSPGDEHAQHDSEHSPIASELTVGEKLQLHDAQTNTNAQYTYVLTLTVHTLETNVALLMHGEFPYPSAAKRVKYTRSKLPSPCKYLAFTTEADRVSALPEG